MVIEHEDGAWGAYVPDLPGCVAVGKSRDEVERLIAEAIPLHIESMREQGEPVPRSDGRWLYDGPGRMSAGREVEEEARATTVAYPPKGDQDTANPLSRHRRMQVPSRVAAQRQRAAESSFSFSSEDSTGELLAVLAASVRTNGRICELGTGLGVGLAWIVAGLEPRTDVAVITIENDAHRSALAQEAAWPAWVQFVTGEATVELPQLGRLDLIFADAEGGKWYGLDLTLSALNPGGMLVLDDLVPQDWKSDTEKETHRQKMDEIRSQIFGNPDIVVTELGQAAGILLAVRRTAPLDIRAWRTWLPPMPPLCS